MSTHVSYYNSFVLLNKLMITYSVIISIINVSYIYTYIYIYTCRYKIVCRDRENITRMSPRRTDGLRARLYNFPLLELSFMFT